jgi:hypothetical protein
VWSRYGYTKSVDVSYTIRVVKLTIRALVCLLCLGVDLGLGVALLRCLDSDGSGADAASALVIRKALGRAVFDERAGARRNTREDVRVAITLVTVEG